MSVLHQFSDRVDYIHVRHWKCQQKVMCITGQNLLLLFTTVPVCEIFHPVQDDYEIVLS